MNEVAKFFQKTAVSAARSLLLSEAKGAVKSFRNKKRAKTIDEVHSEQMKALGYTTSHYKITKDQNIEYRSSPVFVHEFLVNSPLITEKIVRDEETGHTFIDGEQITNAKKLELLNKFIAATNIKNAGLSSHFENALKLIDVSDLNASKFKAHFAGWDVNRESVINQFVRNVFGPVLNTDVDYATRLFRKWIIGTAKRALVPGSVLDGCLTLCGPGGTGKTSLFRNLLPEPFNNRTGEIYCNIRSPQRFTESIIGKTVSCFDELEVLEHPPTREIFKQLLSSQNIDVRLAWARAPRRFALRTGFAATTNKTKFIPDEFFSRRFWTIKLGEGRINFDYLFANRSALWQEAMHLASNSNESYMLSVEEQRQVEEFNREMLVI